MSHGQPPIGSAVAREIALRRRFEPGSGREVAARKISAMSSAASRQLRSGALRIRSANFSRASRSSMVLMASLHFARIVGRKIKTKVAADLRHRCRVGGDARLAEPERLAHRQSPSFEDAGKDGESARRVEPFQLEVEGLLTKMARRSERGRRDPEYRGLAPPSSPVSRR